MPIVLRNQKGSELTYLELDGNFSDLDERSALSYTADSGNALQYASGTYDFVNNIIKYANAVDQETDLSNYDPGDYHGMTMHVHATGGLYYAHAGAWRKLLTDTSHNDVVGAGYVDPLATVAYGGSLDDLTDVKASGSMMGMDHTPTDGQALIWNASMGHWMPTDVVQATSITDLNDVSDASPSNGQVLKWDGSAWAPASDSTADSGSGITLTDLSVSIAAASGNGSLSYDDTTGTFTFTPADVSGFYTNSDVDAHLNVSTAASGQILSWDGSDYAWVADQTSSGGGLSNIVEDTSPQLGGDLDVNGNSIQHTFNVVNNGASDYTFSDAGNHWFPSSENDPVLYLRRGETYVFDVNASGHPFEIRVSSGGSAYNTGVTNNGAQVGQVEFKVPMSAPATLYYQCTVHAAMGNTINIV